MTETWLTVEEVARLENVPVKTIYTRIYRGKYPDDHLRGGDKARREISSFALSKPAASLLAGERIEPAPSHEVIASLGSEEQAVLWRRFRELKVIQACLPYSRARAEAIGRLAAREVVDTRTVRRWLKIIDEGGDWTSVVKRKRYCSAGTTRMDERLVPVLESEFISKRNKKLAYQEMLATARELDIEPPSLRTARRHLKKVQDRLGGMLYIGQRYKEYYDKCEPFLRRDWSGFKPLEMIVGDYKRLDIVVEWFDGTLFYPWASFWRDCGTRTLFYPSISDRPNARGVAGSLRLVMKFWGVPEGLYTDNGKEYKARFLKNAEFVEEVISDIDVPLEAMEALERLNNGSIGFTGNIVKAIPRNSRAKPIERAFGKGGVDQFTQALRGWTGASYKEMPDHTREMMARYRKAKSPDEIPPEYRAMHVTEFYGLLVQWIQQINATPSRADDMMGLSPDQVWQRWVDQGWRASTVVNDAELGLLLSSSKQATLKRGYIRFRNENYTSDELRRHSARTGRSVPVIIRWEEMDCIGYQRHGVRRFAPRQLVVYSHGEDFGQLIGIADHYLGIPMGSSVARSMMEQEIKANREITKEIRKEKREVFETARVIADLREGESLNAVTMSKETIQLSKNRQKFAEISREKDALQRLRELKPRLIDNEDII